MCAMFPMSVWLCVYSVLMLWLDLNCWIDILSGSSNHMPSALSLRMNNLVSKLFGLCYDSWIASLSPHLSPCLDMVFVHCLLPAFWKQLANSLAMFYSRLKDQALLRIHLSQISTLYVLVGLPPLHILCIETWQRKNQLEKSQFD